MGGRARSRANDVSSRSVAFAPVITPAMVARSGSVADPRWSPTGSRLAWIVAHDGRADLVVAPADASGPPVIVTADAGIGGGYAWIDDDELVVAAGDGRASRDRRRRTHDPGAHSRRPRARPRRVRAR